MRFKCKKIILDNIQLYPSDTYGATIEGVFDFDKSVSSSDTVMDGSVYGYSKINAKNINLQIIVKNKNDIRSHLTIQNLISKRKNILTLEYDYLGLVQIEVVATSKSMSNDFGGVTSVVFTAPDPYLYTEVEILQLGVEFSSGLRFPFTFPFKFEGGTTGQVGQIENKGFVDAYPVIYIYGACKNFTLTNETTGQTNTFNRTLGDNDVLKIDCRPNSLGIYLNNVKESNQNITFYNCSTGSNTWRFTRDVPLESVRNCKINLQSRIL